MYLSPRICIFLLLLLFGTNIIAAPVYDLMPIRVTVDSGEKTSSITIKNRGDETALLQVYAQKWSQLNGKDQYQKTQEVIVNPPAFNLAPGEQQVIRLGLRSDNAREQEQIYKLYIKEVKPRLAETNNQFGVKSGTRFILEMSVPVFFAPENPLQIATVTTERKGNQIQVRLSNEGNVHQRVKSLKFYVNDATDPVLMKEEASYVFPHTEREWIFNIEKEKMPTRVIIETSQGQIEQKITS